MIFVDFRFNLQRELVEVYLSDTLRAGAGQFANGRKAGWQVIKLQFPFFRFHLWGSELMAVCCPLFVGYT